ATPSSPCSNAEAPALPGRSPLAASRARRPPAASSKAWAAGLRVLSANTPTTMQPVWAVAGASGFRVNSRVMNEFPCAVPYNRRFRARRLLFGRPAGGRYGRGKERKRIPNSKASRFFMPKLDSYLFREFAQSTFAVLVVLMVVSLGGVFADVLGNIARGRVPAGMMLSQLGLQVLNYLPLILPLGLLLGLLMSVGRLYRDSEAPVLTAIG